MPLSSRSSLTLSIHLFLCFLSFCLLSHVHVVLHLVVSSLPSSPRAQNHSSMVSFDKGFLVFLPGGDQSSPGRVRRPVGLGDLFRSQRVRCPSNPYHLHWPVFQDS